MRSFEQLVAIIVSVLILTVILSIVNDDVLRKDPYHEPSVYVSIREVDVKPVEVTSAWIELNVTAYLNHAGGSTKNASMLIKAINSGTRLLETQVSAPFSGIETGDIQKTLITSEKLKVNRNGDYELKLFIFNNGTIIDSGSVNIQGLNAITPESKESGVIMNNIDFMVGSVSQGNVAIQSDIYLENKGPDASDNLKLVIKAREATSNLLAYKTYSETGSIKKETTVVKNVQIVVPDNYNYMVVVELWRNDVLINQWEKPVLLAPTKTVPKESLEKKVDIEVSKFVRESGMAAPERTPYPLAAEEPYYGEPKAPGFGFITAISIILLLFILKRRL